jgi:hypothetical protein
MLFIASSIFLWIKILLMMSTIKIHHDSPFMISAIKQIKIQGKYMFKKCVIFPEIIS